jgi:outer membrane lipoprotein-sorting protein
MENESSFIVLLKPLAPKLKESLTDVVIHFDRRDFTVSQIEMLEPGGDRTRITFSGKKFNQPMADEKFLVH